MRPVAASVSTVLYSPLVSYRSCSPNAIAGMHEAKKM